MEKRDTLCLYIDLDGKKTTHFWFTLPGIRGIHTNPKQGLPKSMMNVSQSTKRGFSKKDLTGFEKLFLFWVPINSSNTLKGKLEVASFFAI